MLEVGNCDSIQYYVCFLSLNLVYVHDLCLKYGFRQGVWYIYSSLKGLSYIKKTLIVNLWGHSHEVKGVHMLD